MSDKILTIVKWPLMIICALIAAIVMGHITPVDEVRPLLISLSARSADLDMDVELSVVREDGQKESGVFSTAYSSFNTLTFSFPHHTSINGIDLRFDSDSVVHMSSLSITAGALNRTIGVEELLSTTEPVYCQLDGQDEFLLRIEPEAERFGLNWREKFSIREKRMNFSWALSTFLVFLLIMTLLSRGVKTRGFVHAMLASSILACLFGRLSWRMIDKVKSLEVTIEVEEGNHEPLTYETYFSADGVFSGENSVASNSYGHHIQSVFFDLPSGIHRCLRLDFPVDATVALHEVRVELWPFSFSLKGKEILDSFSQFNDLDYSYRDDGVLQIDGGGVDPYLFLGNTSLQERLAFYQVKRWQYPLWLSLALFLILLVVFRTTERYRLLGSALAFGLLLIAPGIAWIFKEKSITLDSEKRQAARWLEEWTTARESTRAVDFYISDQFGGRRSLISDWNLLKMVVFYQTSHSSPVAIGPDGWMFYMAEGVQEMYENQYPYNETQLRKMCAVVEERRKWLAIYGIDYYITFPPMKHTIYEEQLPPRVKRANERSKLDQVIDYLREHSEVKVIDLRSMFARVKQEEELPIYYRVDSHWNLLGGYHAYKEIIDRVRVDHPEIEPAKSKSDFEWHRSESNDGDLVKLLSLSDQVLRDEIIPVPKEGYSAMTVEPLDYPTYVSPHAAQCRILEVDSLPRMLMNRDSYSNFLIPFISEHFSRSVYLWTPLFNPEIIKEEKPDIVITEMLERFIGDLEIDNPPIMANEVMVAASAEDLKP